MLVCLWWLCLLTYTLSCRNIYEFAVNDHFCFMQSFPTLISPASAYRILSNKAKVKYLTVTFTPLCGWLIMVCSFIGDVSVWGTAGALHDPLSLCVETQQRHALDFEVTYRLEQLGKSLMIGFFQAQTKCHSGWLSEEKRVGVRLRVYPHALTLNSLVHEH